MSAQIFVNRQEELDFLERLYRSFLHGLCNGVIVYGLRRVGKTTLIERFLKNKPSITINCAYISTARAFYMEMLSLIAETFGDKNFKRIHASRLNEFQTERRTLMEALKLPVLFSEEKDLKFCLFLDEFHLFLDKVCIKIARGERTSRDKAKLEILWFLKSLAEKKRVFWIISSSLAWEKLLEEFQMKTHESPLLGVFERLEVKPLNREHAIKLALLANPSLDENQAITIAEISGGIPRIILSLAHRLKKGISVMKEAIKLIQQGEFDDFFDNIIRFASEVTKYDYATLCHIMKPLAEGIKTSKEIAQKCGIDRQITHNILNELVKIGLLKRKEGRPIKFEFKYPLLGAWILTRTRTPTESKIEKLACFLGLTAESYVREIFREAIGKKIVIWEDSKGTFFCGTIKQLELKLHKVLERKEINALMRKTRIKNTDIIAEQNNELLIIEVKSGISPLTLQDIEKLAQIRDKISKTIQKKISAIIAYMGLGEIQPSAITQAAKRNIIIMTKEAIKLLAKKLDLPTI